MASYAVRSSNPSVHIMLTDPSVATFNALLDMQTLWNDSNT